MFKATGVVSHSAEAVLRTLCDGAYRTSYDVNVIQNDYLQKICANTYAIYQRAKKIYVVSSRDFVLVTYFHQVSPYSLILLVPKW